MTSYHPNRSRVGADAMSDFIRKPLSGDLKEVPGIAKATEAILKENGIHTTFQLLGKYLSLKEEGIEAVEHTDRFYFWLKSIKTPGGYRAGIVRSIAEKMNILFPGIYDPDAYSSISEEEA
mmetsp:Transcript_20952/g.22760  ORF Transcript_20952/g.22760 Transcript_20952/m.22760 type:complete len:121 (+) Transcript_20952:109-471(+)|eukprot:gene5408-5804_t